jgi:hypothetical protein
MPLLGSVAKKGGKEGGKGGEGGETRMVGGKVE